jgi:hypothetical protein
MRLVSLKSSRISLQPAVMDPCRAVPRGDRSAGSSVRCLATVLNSGEEDLLEDRRSQRGCFVKGRGRRSRRIN